MGCSHSQQKKNRKGVYKDITHDGTSAISSADKSQKVDTHTLSSWTQLGAEVWGISTDIDYVSRNCQLQPWVTCGRHFEVLLPAPVNTEELDVKYNYEEIQIEETGSWKNYRVKLKSNYKHLMLSKYKHSPCLDVAQVIGCRDHVAVLQLVLQDVNQFLVVDLSTERILWYFELHSNSNPYLYECYISPDFTTYVLKPSSMFLLKYGLSDIKDCVSVFSSLEGLCQNENGYHDNPQVKRLHSSNVVVQDTNDVHIDIKSSENHIVSRKINSFLPLRFIADLFHGQSRETTLAFDPGFHHSRLIVGIQHCNQEYTLSQYCLKTGKWLRQVACDQVPGLQSLTFSPCGKVVAASITAHFPNSGALPRKFNFIGVHLYSSDDLSLLQTISASGTCGLHSLCPAAIFPQFSSTGRYIALGGGNGTEVNRVDVFSVPCVLNLQHQCRLVLLDWLGAHKLSSDILTTDEKIKDYLKFKPWLE